MRKYISVIVLVGWVGLVLYLSYQNGQETADTSMAFTEYIVRFFMKAEPDGAVLLLWDGRFRLAAHFVLFFLYGILSILVLEEWARRRSIILGISAISGITLAVLSEAGKIPIPGRHCDLPEMGLNIIGAMVGTLITFLLCRMLKKE